MQRTHERLLVATLAGLVIACAAAFAVQPALAAGYYVDGPAKVVGVKKWDVLNIRKWPASYSRKTGELEPRVHVWVERCIIAPTGGSDWCLVERADQRGWVNSQFLRFVDSPDI